MGEIDVTPSSRALESGGATATPLPSRPPQAISAHLTLQAPLSRRGNGPGLILVVDHYAPLDASEKSLDPPPLIKWAEEGFAVIQVLVPGKVDDGGEFPLEKAIECLKGCEGCDTKEGEGFGLISYLTRIPFYIEEAVCLSPHIAGIVSYGGRPFSSISPSTPALPPQLIHIAGPNTPRRPSISVVPDSPPLPSTSRPSKLRSHRYLEAKKDAAWILPADDDYHAPSAALAHTRSLAFLKPLLGGPWFDLEAVWDEHCLYEFVERDVDKTMATMVAQPYVNHIPTMTGGIGQEKLRDFYANHFIHANPPSTNMTLVSRTIGTDRIIDEFTFSLIHDRQVDWLLPGVPPTHKQLNIPFVSVVALRGDRLCHEHIHWDQATALRQAGLLPEYVPFEGKVEGAEGQRVEVRLPVAGVETARKLVDEGCVESNELMGKGWRVVDGVKKG